MGTFSVQNLILLYKATPHIVHDIILRLRPTDIFCIFQYDSDFSTLIQSDQTLWTKLINRDYPFEHFSLTLAYKITQACKNQGTNADFRKIYTNLHYTHAIWDIYHEFDSQYHEFDEESF